MTLERIEERIVLLTQYHGSMAKNGPFLCSVYVSVLRIKFFWYRAQHILGFGQISVPPPPRSEGGGWNNFFRKNYWSNTHIFDIKMILRTFVVRRIFVLSHMTSSKIFWTTQSSKIFEILSFQSPSNIKNHNFQIFEIHSTKSYCQLSLP